MMPTRLLIAFLAVAACAPAGAADYLGLLRPSSAALALPETGFYAGLSAPRLSAGLTGGPGLKLGYRYSRFLAVETGFYGAGALQAPKIESPWFMANRGRRAWIDTIATLPLWTHASLFGRFGAFRSEGMPIVQAPQEGTARAGSRLRYGLGLNVDLSRNVGLQAELERHSPGERAGNADTETDQVSVGLTWRF